MSAAKFKKVDNVSKVASGLKAGAVDRGAVNGSLVKPGVSLFHRLPKITRRETCTTEALQDTLNGPTSEHIGNSSYEDGIRDGERKASLVYLDTIKLLETSLQTLNNQYQLIRSEIETSHCKAVAMILTAVLPQMAEYSAMKQIRSLIKEFCSASTEVSIRIHVNPTQADQISVLVDSYKQAENIVVIVPDHQIEKGNIRCEWEGGGVEIDTNTVVQQSLAILDLALADNKTTEGRANG